LTPEQQEFGGQEGRCVADSLIRRQPAADDTIALEKLATTAVALRRLIYQLIDIGLPVDHTGVEMGDWHSICCPVTAASL